MKNLENAIIELVSDDYGSIHRKPVTGGLVLYYVSSGRNGWHDRMAHILFLGQDNLLKYFDRVRISHKLNEQFITRRDKLRVVVENDEETIGDPNVEEKLLRVPFYVHHHNQRSRKLVTTLLKQEILTYDLDNPNKSCLYTGEI